MTCKRKVRKESGRRYNKFYDPENGQYYVMYWDDWNDYRDGYRDAFTDRTLIHPKDLSQEHWSGRDRFTDEVNTKIARQLRIRKMRKRCLNGTQKITRV